MVVDCAIESTIYGVATGKPFPNSEVGKWFDWV
jgi:hypothetical protein